MHIITLRTSVSRYYRVQRSYVWRSLMPADIRVTYVGFVRNWWLSNVSFIC